MAITPLQRTTTCTLLTQTIANCEKIRPKLKVGSPQATLTANRIQALTIAKCILEQQRHTYSAVELATAIVQLTSIRNKSETALAHAKRGSGTETRLTRIITAMTIAISAIQADGAFLALN